MSSRLAVILNLLALAGLAGPAQAQPSQAVCGGNLVCLDQGWSDAQRSWWYTTSQGSRLLPLSWMLALESADASAPGEKFLSEANIRRWGYLPNPVSPENPHGLPLGFAVDEESTSAADVMCSSFPASCAGMLTRQKWMGLTCAACHTSDIEFGDAKIRIDGASTLADFQGFGEDLLAALKSTLEEPQKFGRFASAVLSGQSAPQDRAGLKTQLAEHVAWQQKLQRANKGSVRYGHGRIDAQGHILNKVALTTLIPDQIADIRADAPANTPFIWNTAQQSKLQWNGIAINGEETVILGTTTQLGALVRNISEVIGVFAHVETHKGQALEGYRSSVQLPNIIDLEAQLATLKSPRWPERILGAIDGEMAARGERHFESAECATCHGPLGRDDLATPIEVVMTPIQDIETDIFLACNAFFHRSKAGNFEGQPDFTDFSETIAPVDYTRKMLVLAAIGALQGELVTGEPERFDNVSPAGRGDKRGPLRNDFLPSIADKVKRDLADKCHRTQDEILLAYKARPLNGIWATAPYLHNGSVPTLYDLFLPAKLRLTRRNAVSALPDTGEFRPETFGVGSAQFDAKKVGFVTDLAANPTTFRVRDAATGEPIPGNYNSGHDYGTTLTEQERLELVEYLKTL